MAAQPATTAAPFEPAKLYVWVKSLESKTNNLIREVDLLKNDVLRRQGQLKKEYQVMNEDLVEFRHQQEALVQKMDLLVKELKKTAGSEEVQTLKKYMDLWNPLNFVTQRDVERVIEAKLAERDFRIQQHKD